MGKKKNEKFFSSFLKAFYWLKVDTEIRVQYGYGYGNNFMKNEKNAVIITQDGWVFVIDHGKQIGLGDIGVDCTIVDLRENIPKSAKKKYFLDKVKTLRESGLSYRDISQEVGLSHQTIMNWLKKYEK